MLERREPFCLCFKYSLPVKFQRLCLQCHAQQKKIERNEHRNISFAAWAPEGIRKHSRFPTSNAVHTAGLQEVLISNLLGHYMVFNNTTKEFAFEKRKKGGGVDFDSKMYFMNNFQIPPKHEGTLGSYSPCFILFLIDSSNYKIMSNLWVFMLETSRVSLTGALLANRTNL